MAPKKKEAKEKVENLCECGCGEIIINPDSKGRNRRFIHGHNMRVQLENRGDWTGKKHKPESRKKQSEAALKREKKRRDEGGWHHGEEAKRKIGEASKNRPKSLKTRALLSQKLKGREVTWDMTPAWEAAKKWREENYPLPEEFLEKLRTWKDRNHTEDEIRKISEGNIKNWENNPDRRKAQSDRQRGEKCHFWRGGVSGEKYPEEWNNQLRSLILKRDGNICLNPECEGKGIDHDGKRNFSVHHIDYDKNNCDPDNLITLCISCHTRTTHNREYYPKILKRVLLLRGVLLSIPRKSIKVKKKGKENNRN